MTRRSGPPPAVLAALVAAAVMVVALLPSTRTASAQDLDQPEVDDRADVPPPDERDVAYADTSDPRQTLDVYLPTEPGADRPAVIFIHGGGFRRGTKSTFRLEGDLARQRGWVGFSINYRLDADPGHPAEMDDVLTATRWIRDHADDYGVDPSRIALWGTSAGGNLAALAAASATGPLSEGDRVVAAVAFSGPMDLVVVHDSRNAATVEAYLGCTPTECPDLYADASATSHVTPDDPTMFLAHSEREGVPVAATEDLAARLEVAGVPVELVVVPGSLHARNLSLRTPGLMDDAFEFLDAVFGASPETGDVVPPEESVTDDGGVDAAPSTTSEKAPPTSAGEIEQPSDSPGSEGQGFWLVTTIVLAVLLVGATSVAVVFWRRR